MPCYRCGARQVDPARGASPWKRGVRQSRQVLVCPDCQRDHDWVADLDRCASCGSTTMVRRLGEVSCRTCGAAEHVAEPGVPEGRPAASALADEVRRALDRLFGR